MLDVTVCSTLSSTSELDKIQEGVNKSEVHKKQELNETAYWEKIFGVSKRDDSVNKEEETVKGEVEAAEAKKKEEEVAECKKKKEKEDRVKA